MNASYTDVVPRVEMSQSPTVVISLALRGTPLVVNGQLRAATRLTHAPIIVHMERGTRFWWHTERWVSGCCWWQVFMNPARLPTAADVPAVKTSGSRRARQRALSAAAAGATSATGLLPAAELLLAHLSNLDFCDRPGMPCARATPDARVLLIGEDFVFFRHGVEAWILGHSMARPIDSWWHSGSFYPLTDLRAVLEAWHRVAPNATCRAFVCAQVRELLQPGELPVAVRLPHFARVRDGVGRRLPDSAPVVKSLQSLSSHLSGPWTNDSFNELYANIGVVARQESEHFAFELPHQHNVPAKLRPRFEGLMYQGSRSNASSAILASRPYGGFMETCVGTLSLCAASAPGHSDCTARHVLVAGKKRKSVVCELKHERLARADSMRATPGGSASSAGGTLGGTVTGTSATAGPRRVACIGDSITAGVGSAKRNGSYPALLQKLLGAGYAVSNLGASGTKVQRQHNRSLEPGAPHVPSYWRSPQFRAFAGSSWDAVVIMLGTNDVGEDAPPSSLLSPSLCGSPAPLPGVDTSLGPDVPDLLGSCPFVSDYLALIDEVRALGRERGNPPTILLAIPPPMLFDPIERPTPCTLSGDHLHRLLPSVIRAVAQRARLPPPLDVFRALGGELVLEMPFACSRLAHAPPAHCGLFTCDRVHPNTAGYEVLARLVAGAL